MDKPATHIIHKLNLEIEVPGERMARYMYDQAGRLLQEHVLPMLEAILKEYKEEEHIRLDALTLNLDVATTGALEETIRQQLAIAIGKQLKQTLESNLSEQAAVSDHQERTTEDKRPEDFEDKGPDIKISTGPQQLVEAFLLFLENGIAPWWLAGTKLLAQSTEIVNAIAQQEEQFVALFLDKVSKKSIVLERLLLQYDSVLLTYLFSLVAPLPLLTAALQYEQRLFSEQDRIQLQLPEETRRQQYWATVWRLTPILELKSLEAETFIKRLEVAMQVYTRKDSSTETHKEEIHRTRPEEVRERADTLEVPGLQQEIPMTASEQNRAQNTVEQKHKDKELVNNENEVLVHHAGLILLHPYLQHFFLALNLIEGTQFKDKRSAGIAVHLLHYLATGEEQAADFDLVFEKYLCGIDKGLITYRFTELEEQMKTEATSLLTAVIRNWPALKSTTPDGLRGNFLQRKGKLQLANDHHKLVMERQVFDVLLDQIPWNISLVKLPWHDHLIHVEWT